MRDNCQPTCIDLILTDQPNLVLDSGVRPSLDQTVKHQITYCKVNYKIPPLPSYKRKLWYYDRADQNLINRAISEFPWEIRLRGLDPTEQTKLLNETLLNIMSNFVPNEFKTIRPREPEWMTKNIKTLLRKQNKNFRKYKKNGYKNEDKVILERSKLTCQEAISNAKDTHLKTLGHRLANPSTGQKTYWKIMNKFLNKCKIPRIPPLWKHDRFITDCKAKASLFNEHFCKQCTPFENDSELPEFSYLTESRINTIDVTDDEILEILKGLNVNKASGPDNISIHMLKLCGDDLRTPLKIIFKQIINTGIFPDQWKRANVTPVHKKEDKQLISNYRPISLLPALAKI